MPRGYGYGASMGAWVLDYVAAWAGEWGHITHSKATYRNPAFTGDATFLEGEIVDTRVERRRKHIVTAKVELRNQDDTIMLPSATACRSRPEQKPRPAPVRMITLTLRSCSAWSKSSDRFAIIAVLIAFNRSGRFSVMKIGRAHV